VTAKRRRRRKRRRKKRKAARIRPQRALLIKGATSLRLAKKRAIEEHSSGGYKRG
jgi:hypothetical protein